MTDRAERPLIRGPEVHVPELAERQVGERLSEQATWKGGGIEGAREELRGQGWLDPKQARDLARQLAEAEERLTLIARNANAWHHDAEAKQRALNVIAAWASGGELPAVLLADLRGNPPDPPASPAEGSEAATEVEGA